MSPDRSLSAIVHDAQNALAAAMGRLHLLRRRLERGDHGRATEDAREAEAALRRLSELLDDLDDLDDGDSTAADRL